MVFNNFEDGDDTSMPVAGTDVSESTPEETPEQSPVEETPQV